jgi:Uncharacterized conserved protein (COG2071).
MKSFHQDGWIQYKSVRCDRRGDVAQLDLKYRPVGDPCRATGGTLEHFLTERYCLYTTSGDQVVRGHVHHEQWSLQAVESEIQVNTMLLPLGIDVVSHQNPKLHYSKEMLTVEWAPEAVTPE